MSKGTRPVPTNLDSWPGVTDLVIEYKHILYVLWSSPPHLVSVVGVGQAGIIERLCGCTRLDEPVVVEALRELDRRGLVSLDEQTREVGIRRWCAFHKFAGRWAAAAADAYEEIASPKIKGIWAKDEGVKALFPAKSNNSSPTATATATATSSLHACSAPGGAQPAAGGGDAMHAGAAGKDGVGEPQKPKPASSGARCAPLPPVGADGRFVRPHPLSGVDCWYPSEIDPLEQLIAEHGEDAVVAAAKKIAEGGGKPLLSYTTKILKGQKSGNDNRNFIPRHGQQQQQQQQPDDPLAAAAERSRQRRAAAS